MREINAVRWNQQERERKAAAALTALAFMTVVIIFAADVATPRTVSFASLAVVPLVIVAWLPGHAYRWLIGTSLVLFAIAVALGGLSVQSAAMVGVACLCTAAAIRMARKPAEPSGLSARETAIEVLAGVQRASVDAAEAALAQAGLTRRERQVVELAVRGLTGPDIAARLFIGERTVETHLAHAYAKLGVRSKQELIAKIVR